MRVFRAFVFAEFQTIIWSAAVLLKLCFMRRDKLSFFTWKNIN